MTSAEQSQLQELLDREAIRECLYTYSRGIDRRDETALRAAYWPEATDRHGPYSGTAKQFIDTALTVLVNAPRMVHMIGNVSILLKGQHAAVESYFHAYQHDRDGEGRLRATILAGRYVDHFEKRGSQWRVLNRTVVYDWIEEKPGIEGDDASKFGARNPNGGQKPNDAWYALLAKPPFAD